MKTNSLLTYLLYALLATLIIAAGFKACQMQKEKQLKAQEEAEWEETHRKLHPQTDSISEGSSYVSRDSAELATTGTNSPTMPKSTENKPSKTTPTKPTTTTGSSTTTPPKTTTTKGSSTAAKGAGSGRWVVRAGTFSQMDNARDQLEKVIQMGYTNAEISKTSSGKAAVIVLRTNDKAKAVNTADQLERRGLDAAVFDRNKKD